MFCRVWRSSCGCRQQKGKQKWFLRWRTRNCLHTEIHLFSLPILLPASTCQFQPFVCTLLSIILAGNTVVSRAGKGSAVTGEQTNKGKCLLSPCLVSARLRVKELKSSLVFTTTPPCLYVEEECGWLHHRVSQWWAAGRKDRLASSHLPGWLLISCPTDFSFRFPIIHDFI